MSLMVSNAMPEQRDSDAGIERKLVRAWRRERAFVDVRGISHVLLWAAVVFAIDFAIDWTFNLSSTGRFILLALSASLMGAVIYWRWLRHVKRYDPVRTALEIESCHPQLNSLLISYVQLRNRNEHDPHVSQGLVKAMCEQAVKKSEPMDFGQIVQFRTLRNLIVACVVVLLLGAAAAWQGNELISVFLGRMSNPFSKLRYPTKTILEPLTENGIVQEGRSFSPSTWASGEVPQQAALIIRPLDGEMESVTISAGKEEGGKRQFAYNLGDVYRSFTYAFRIGDAVSDTYTVTVVPPPRVKFSVTTTFPEYTHREPAVAPALTLEVLEGSHLEWVCEFDRALDSAEIVLDRPLDSAESVQDGQEVKFPLILDDAGLTGRIQLGGAGKPLTKLFNYSFRWKDRENGFKYAPATQYTVQVVPDRGPRVALASPSRDLSGTVQKIVDLRVVASDDFGLSSARLLYSVSNDSTTGKGSIPETALPVSTDALKKQPLDAKLSFKVALHETIPDLAPGDVVSLAVEVSDNRPEKPSITRSETRRITILSPADYLVYIKKQRDRLLSQIRELHSVEKNAAETLEEELIRLEQEKENPK